MFRKVVKHFNGIVYKQGVRIQEEDILPVRRLQAFVVGSSESKVLASRNQCHALIVCHGFYRTVCRTIVHHDDLVADAVGLGYDAVDARLQDMPCIIVDENDGNADYLVHIPVALPLMSL